MTGTDGQVKLRSEIRPLSRNLPGAERVGRALKDLVVSGSLMPSEKLPSESDLAHAFGVSRPVVREALRGLAMLGIVQSNQGGGCYVTDLGAERLLEPLSFYIALRDYSVDELFDARGLIEGESGRNAARLASGKQREQLLELARLGHDLVADPIGFRVLDAQFHRLIWEAARNGFLQTVSRSLYSLAMDLRRRASATPGVLEQSARDHQAIAEAIAAGDAEAAARAMSRHCEHIRKTTLQAAQAAATTGSKDARKRAGR